MAEGGHEAVRAASGVRAVGTAAAGRRARPAGDDHVAVRRPAGREPTRHHFGRGEVAIRSCPRAEGAALQAPGIRRPVTLGLAT